MFKFSAKLLTAADAWDGVDTKIHLQDNHYWAKKVFNGLKSQFGQIAQQYKIKGVALQEWIKEYGMQGLFAAQDRDPAIRKALNDVRSLLKDTVVSTDQGGQFRNNEIDAFKKEHGSNVADWLFELTGQKRANRKRKTGSDKCRYCEAPVAARWWEHGETPMCSQCIQEDEAAQENFKPRNKGVISGLLTVSKRGDMQQPPPKYQGTLTTVTRNYTNGMWSLLVWMNGEPTSIAEAPDPDVLVQKARSMGAEPHVVTASMQSLPSQRFAPPTDSDWDPDAQYEDFKDIEVLFMDEDENDITARVSGTLCRDEWGDLSMELDPESQYKLQDVDLEQNEILHQISEQVRF